MNCPICGKFLPDGSRRCTACGADFQDPDVLAMLRAPKRPPSSVVSSDVRRVGVGGLSIDRFLGMTSAGIADGTSLQRVGLYGAACLLLGFLVPIDLDFHGSEMPLAVLDKGPRAALLVPLILALAGGAVALLKKGAVPPVVIAAMLAAGGIAELALGLAPFGHAAGAASSLPVLTWGGVLVAAIGVSIRILRPGDPFAKWFVLTGAIGYVVGGLLPHDDVSPLVPLEYQAMAPLGRLDGSILGLAWDATSDAFTLVHAAIALLPVALLPLATALAFRRPSGVWDGAGHVLRGVGIAIVLWLPLGHLLGIVNAWGWPAGVYFDGQRSVPMDVLTHGLVLGRVRLLLLSLGASLWLTCGASALWVWYRGVRDGSSRTSSAR